MANFPQLRAAETQAAEYQSVVNQRQQQIEQAEKNIAATPRILPVSKAVLLRTTAANRPALQQAQIERNKGIANIQQQIAQERQLQQQYQSDLQQPNKKLPKLKLKKLISMPMKPLRKLMTKGHPLWASLAKKEITLKRCIKVDSLWMLLRLNSFSNYNHN